MASIFPLPFPVTVGAARRRAVALRIVAGGRVPDPPLVTPHSGLDGWTLAGTSLAERFSRADEHELARLLHYVDIRSSAPCTYERAVALLVRAGEYEQALAVCQVWFTLPLRVRRRYGYRNRALYRRRMDLIARVDTGPPADQVD